MKTAVVIITFNRPQLTQKVFEVIKNIQPPELLLISDGQRNNKEVGLINQTRNIITQVNWPCKIHKKFEPKNLGCKKAVESGLEWVFSKVEQAIIL